MKRYAPMAIVTAALLAALAGCAQPAMSRQEVETVTAQYGVYQADMTLQEALDWADAVIQVDVIANNGLSESLRRQNAVAVHVVQAISGSVADSPAVNTSAMAALMPGPDSPELSVGDKLILAVRERTLDSGEAVFDYTASLTYYLYEGTYLISAAKDNETTALNGHTLEGLTEEIIPIFHPGQNQFTRSSLSGPQRETMAKEAGFVIREDGERLDYGRLRAVLAACKKDEARIDLMTVGQDGTLTQTENLYEGGGTVLTALPAGWASNIPAGSHIIVAQDQVLYGVNDGDQLISLWPEAPGFVLTGITVEQFTQSLPLIAKD